MLKRQKVDHLYGKAAQLLQEWADLGDGEEEQELLVNYIHKMTALQNKRKMQLGRP